jgi:hypothetical protein
MNDDERDGRYAVALREAGASEEEIERIVAQARAEWETIKAGKCPKCGAPVRSYLDHRGLRSWQDPKVAGQWVMYRCSTQSPPGSSIRTSACDFMLDRFEEMAVTS